MGGNMNKEITFIVCTKNSIETIEKCLESIRNFPVILVDKDSTDETLEVAKKFKNVKIINQKGNGLANARNLGLEKVKTKYVLIWGSDNIYLLNSYSILDILYEYLQERNYIGVGFLTRIENPKTYFDKCIHIWWKNKIKSGESKVVGTPVLYDTKVLKQFKYNENCTHADDCDLGERLYQQRFKQGYCNSYCYDISKNNIKNILDRFTRYGISDKEYNKKYCNTFKSKIKSYLHTLISDFTPNLYFIPFWFIILVIRFIGRLK